jgi:hypothetical protein
MLLIQQSSSVLWTVYLILPHKRVRVSTSLLPNLRTERVCSFSSMRAVSADPCTHRLMMHAQLASDVTVTHALFRKRQSLSFSRLIGFPDTWQRGEVQLTRAAAKSLTPRSIFPAFDDPILSRCSS